MKKTIVEQTVDVVTREKSIREIEIEVEESEESKNGEG